MQDLLELKKWCTDLPDRIEEGANELARDVVRVVDRSVVASTPVDVTEAVSNWQPGVGSAPGFALPAIYPGSGGSTAPQSRQEAIAHVERALADKAPGQAFYVSNLAEHIVYLNDGSSDQEPAGFVERGVRLGELHAESGELDLT